MRSRLARTLGAITAATLVAAVLVYSPAFDTTPHAEATGQQDFAALAAQLQPFMPTAVLAATVPAGAHGVGLVDPEQGIWHLRTRDGDPASFFYGNPGDYPFMGDWNCNGIDTPGLYRQSDGYVYLRNSNTQGPANIKFFFGNPGDIPLPGDFNADGCDTVSLYRPSQQRIYVINKLGSEDGGLGEADYSYVFGNPGDKPFTGDFNGNGITTVGLHRESTGFMYFRNTNTQGNAHYQFYFGNPGDRLLAGDWTGAGEDFPAVFRPSQRKIYMRFANTQGNADEEYTWGESTYIPVAGVFGTLNTGVTVNVSGAPAQLKYAIESFYNDQQSAPHIPAGLRTQPARPPGLPEGQDRHRRRDECRRFGDGVAVAQVNGDTLLAITENGWEWKVVGANPSGLGRSLYYGGTRHVAIIGTDWQQSGATWPSNRNRTNADSVHIYAANPLAGAGAIVGFPRSTYIATPSGEDRIAKTTVTGGPSNTVESLKLESGLPIEGYLITGMGSFLPGAPPGFSDLVDAFGGFPFLVPYEPLGGNPAVGDTFLVGNEAIAWARERQNSPHGGTDRTLNQGMLMKAALATVKPLGMDEIPNLLSIMDGFVGTDLWIGDLLTLAASVYTIDPGPMPTATPQDFIDAGHATPNGILQSHGPYNQNDGTLPNVVMKGCLYSPDNVTFGYKLQPQHDSTWTDLQDGVLGTKPWICDDGS